MSGRGFPFVPPRLPLLRRRRASAIRLFYSRAALRQYLDRWDSACRLRSAWTRNAERDLAPRDIAAPA